MSTQTKECHIIAAYYAEAYKLGARWNPDTCKWIIDAKNKEFKPYIKNNNTVYKFLQHDHPELHLDDRRRSEPTPPDVDHIRPAHQYSNKNQVDKLSYSISEIQQKVIKNIFLHSNKYDVVNSCDLHTFIYYRANCMCELCYTPIKRLYDMGHIVYEERCQVYRCVCKDCSELVTLNLGKKIIPEIFDKYMELSGLTSEELEKKLVEIYDEE